MRHAKLALLKQLLRRMTFYKFAHVRETRKPSDGVSRFHEHTVRIVRTLRRHK